MLVHSESVTQPIDNIKGVFRSFFRTQYEMIVEVGGFDSTLRFALIANRCAAESSLPQPYTGARIEAFETCTMHRRMTGRGGRHVNLRSLPPSE
jgi:hypothetical protein